MKSAKKQNAPEVTPRLTFDEKENMLVHLLRLKHLFSDAKNQLKVEHFNLESEKIYALVWRVALELAENNNGILPEKGLRRRIAGKISSIAEASPDTLTEREYNELMDVQNGFINYCFNFPDDELTEKDGRLLLETFLRERTIIDPLKKFIVDSGEGNPLNLRGMLRKLEEQELKITAVKTNPISNAFPDNWRPKPVQLIPTGVPFLDSFMGGQAGGEAYGILGPTGVGKTSLGIMLAVEGSKYEQFNRPPAEIGHWYFISYESSVESDIRLRVLSYAAQIKRDILFSGEKLSVTGDLKDYERIKWNDAYQAGLSVPGETERLNSASYLRKNLWLVDMSGSLEENPKIGSGGVQEIVDYLALEQDSGKRIAGVVIDYVGIAVKRFMSNNGVGYDLLRHYIGGYGDEARMRIAARFKCPVWLLHQLTGEANMRSPTAKQHHALAAEAKNFADNLWYCFNIGTKDPETNTCIIHCSKQRRSYNNLTPVVFIDGALCTMRAADDLYTVDNGKIVSKQFKAKRIEKADLGKMRFMSGVISPAAAAGMITTR